MTRDEKINLDGKLTEFEQEKYGDRCPLGYRKYDIIGKG
jgi:hypothetical protein